jgi:hypothetical protein
MLTYGVFDVIPKGKMHETRAMSLIGRCTNRRGYSVFGRETVPDDHTVNSVMRSGESVDDD